jgi:hypothetical protein
VGSGGDSQGELKVILDGSGASAVSWNGTNALGNAVQSGTYMVQVTGQVAGGPVETTTKAVTVIYLQGSDPLGTAIIAPNPGTLGGPLRLIMQATGGNLVVRLYTLNGDLAGEWNEPANAGELVLWPTHGLAPGIYLAALELDAPGSIPQRRVLKWAITP